MSNDVIITVDKLSKLYHLGEIGVTSLRDSTDRLVRNVRSTLGGLRSRLPKSSNEPGCAVLSCVDDLWALKDISFEVKRGEVLGIIGRNGAGKSTLLKILSRITEPTSGKAILRGRVGSLLEVGTGFHPELTGRENIYLNGAILGMKRREIAAKFDEIVAFSEVEKFIDTPVKRYSSGMYVRLAFAVAAHLDPEILLVDEVLAVGDVSFQKKCLGKMSDVAKHGRTVLFVSHNMIAVNSLCRRALWLDQGALVEDSVAADVVASYLRSGLTESSCLEWTEENAPGNERLRVLKAGVLPEKSNDDNEVTLESGCVIGIEFVRKTGDLPLHVTLHVRNQEHIVVFTSSNISAGIITAPGRYQVACHVPAHFLNTGQYFVTVLFVRNGNLDEYHHENLISFTVKDKRQRESGYMGREPGITLPELEWELKCQSKLSKA